MHVTLILTHYMLLHAKDDPSHVKEDISHVKEDRCMQPKLQLKYD